MIQLSLLNTKSTFSYIYLSLQLYVSQALHIQFMAIFILLLLISALVFFFSV